MADKNTIKEAVKTPLGFFVLVVVVIEAGLLGSMKITDTTQHQTTLYIFATIMILLVICVTAISIFKPGALTGKSYDLDALGHSIGSEIYHAFNPYISNLTARERNEAYQSLLTQMESPTDKVNRTIRLKIANVIRSRSGLKKS